jgi:hypothetical protein
MSPSSLAAKSVNQSREPEWPKELSIGYCPLSIDCFPRLRVPEGSMGNIRAEGSQEEQAATVSLVPVRAESLYSYRSASMGSRRLAFQAG